MVDSLNSSALTRGAHEVFPIADFEAKLKLGRPLRVKLGFDPTRPDLHLGHAVVLQGLRAFQEAGHQIVVIIGDFTAQIGDPTGKEVARPPLSPGEIEQNSKTYLEQLGIVVAVSKAEIRRNSEWLEALSLTESIRLLAKATVAQMLTRDNFAKRYDRGDPIGLHEFLYPLLQGYDSVATEADIELGGSDQRFNLLAGRDVQQAYGQIPQVCVTYPILVGIDGNEKMSKSQNNTIGLTMPASEIFGRTMSIPDSLLENWYRLASGLPAFEILEITSSLTRCAVHPRDAKMRLAFEIVKTYCGADVAVQAQEAFIRQFQRRELPTTLQEKAVADRPYTICSLLVDCGLVGSTSEARRLIGQGGVRLHEGGGTRTFADPKEMMKVPDGGLILQVGKRRFARVVVRDHTAQGRRGG